MYTPKTKEWFKERIGKTIYRDATKHCCNTCDHVATHGVTVADEDHAEYLAMIDMDFGADGVYSNYRDTQ